MDTTLGSRLNEALIKKITGGEPERARFLHSNEFEYIPEYSLWLAVNHIPEIKDTTKSIWRRVVYIPFDVVFEEVTDDAEKRVDPDLLLKLLEERDGILTWLVQGAMQWVQAGRLIPPQYVVDAIQGYRDEMDVIARFVAERCEWVEDEKIQSKTLYDAYAKWVISDGGTPDSHALFGRSMKEHEYKKKTAYGKVYYLHMRLRPEFDAIDDEELLDPLISPFEDGAIDLDAELLV